MKREKIILEERKEVYRCQVDRCARDTIEGRPFFDTHEKKTYTPVNLEWYRL